MYQTFCIFYFQCDVFVIELALDYDPVTRRLLSKYIFICAIEVSANSVRGNQVHYGMYREGF